MLWCLLSCCWCCLCLCSCFVLGDLKNIQSKHRHFDSLAQSALGAIIKTPPQTHTLITALAPLLQFTLIAYKCHFTLVASDHWHSDTTVLLIDRRPALTCVLSATVNITFGLFYFLVLPQPQQKRKSRHNLQRSHWLTLRRWAPTSGHFYLYHLWWWYHLSVQFVQLPIGTRETERDIANCHQHQSW